MKYFHGQDQSNCSSKQVNDRFVAEAAPLSPSETERYSELHTTEPPIEFHEEETRIRYAMPSLDQQEKGEISMREDTCETMQSADEQVISCSLSKQEHDAFIQETSALSSSGIWHILDTNEEERVKTRNTTRLVAPTIDASLGALTHTLGTLVSVIRASGFATVAAATTIGTVAGSFR